MTRKPRPNYFGNKKTRIIHDARNNNDSCRASEIKLANRQSFDTYEEAKDAGYRACRRCIEVE